MGSQIFFLLFCFLAFHHPFSCLCYNIVYWVLVGCMFTVCSVCVRFGYKIYFCVFFIRRGYTQRKSTSYNRCEINDEQKKIGFAISVAVLYCVHNACLCESFPLVFHTLLLWRIYVKIYCVWEKGGGVAVAVDRYIFWCVLYDVSMLRCVQCILV